MLKKIGKKSEIKKQQCMTINGKNLAIFLVEDKCYCIANECTHRGGPLCEGLLRGTTIVCPWHAGEFNITTGKVLKTPPEKPVKTYKVTEKNGELFVDIS